MLDLVLAGLARHLPPSTVTTEAVNCHDVGILLVRLCTHLLKWLVR